MQWRVFSRTRRRQYERVVTARDYRPSVYLWWRGRLERGDKPFAKDGGKLDSGFTERATTSLLPIQWFFRRESAAPTGAAVSPWSR